MNYLTLKENQKLLTWITKLKNPEKNWAIEYLDKKGIRTIEIQGQIYFSKKNFAIGLDGLSNLEAKSLDAQLRNAWRQKKSRMKKENKYHSIKLSKESIRQIERISKKSEINKNQAINKIISDESLHEKEILKLHEDINSLKQKKDRLEEKLNQITLHQIMIKSLMKIIENISIEKSIVETLGNLTIREIDINAIQKPENFKSVLERALKELNEIRSKFGPLQRSLRLNEFDNNRLEKELSENLFKRIQEANKKTTEGEFKPKYFT